MDGDAAAREGCIRPSQLDGLSAVILAAFAAISPRGALLAPNGPLDTRVSAFLLPHVDFNFA